MRDRSAAMSVTGRASRAAPSGLAVAVASILIASLGPVMAADSSAPVVVFGLWRMLLGAAFFAALMLLERRRTVHRLVRGSARVPTRSSSLTWQRARWPLFAGVLLGGEHLAFVAAVRSTLLTRAGRHHMEASTLLAGAFAVGALVVAVPALFESGPGGLGMSGRGLRLAVALAGVPGLIAHRGLAWAAPKLPAVVPSVITLLAAPATTATGWLLLGQQPSGRQIAGGVVAAAGVIMTLSAVARGRTGESASPERHVTATEG